MKRSVRSRLVDRLRNGKPLEDGTRKPYKQITSRLGRPDNGELPRCILGVLCDLAEEDGIVTKEYRGEKVVYKATNGDYGDYSDTELPSAVKVWAGVKATSPRVPNGKYYGESLIHLNDHGILDFEGFAKLIEQHPDL